MDHIQNPYSNTGQMVSSGWQANPAAMQSNTGHGMIPQQPQAQAPQQMPPMQHQMQQQQQPQMIHQAQRPPQMHPQQQQQQQVNLPQMMPQQPPAPLPQQPPQQQPPGRMSQMPPMQQQTQQPIHPQQPLQPSSQAPSHGPHQPQQPPGQQVTPQSQPPMPNTMVLCRLGQDTVQEIVSKTSDLFNFLKASTAQLPNGTTQSINTHEERKTRIAEFLRNINVNFKRLRAICDKINEGTSDIDLVQPFVESLIPIVGSTDRVFEDKKKNMEVVKKLTEERNALAEQVKRKNQQVKEVIDMLRDITWDINTMLAMRKR